MLLDKDGIIKRLLLAEERAEKEVERLKENPNLSLGEYRCHIYRFVLAKLLLDDEKAIVTSDLNELTDLSVAKAGRLNPNETVLLDVSKHCGSTTSAMTKKVLLFMAVEECFNIKLKGINTAEIETCDELAEIIRKLLLGKESVDGH